jgi:hypothetical protein
MSLLTLRSVITLLLLVICVCAQATPASGVCGAKHSPTKFVGQSVAVRGKIVSDGMHTTILVPDQCSDEGYAIVPSEKDDDAAAIIR